MQRIARPPRLSLFSLMMSAAMVLASASRAEEVSRLDLPRIAREVQTKGLADYIPVAYKTVGIESQYWSPADNHARAHFLLYMAKDCSHFVMKWEIPALIPIDQGNKQSRDLEQRNTGISTRPGGGPKVCSLRDEKRNLVMNSMQVGPMRRIWTRGPFNAALDAAHTRASWDIDKWGALVHVELAMTGGEAGLATPIATYNTPSSENGDPLSGGCVMEVPEDVQRQLQRMVRVRGPTFGSEPGQVGPSLPTPLHWRVVANVFNVTMQKSMAELRETYVEYKRVGDAAFEVVDVFLVLAAATTPEAALMELAIGAVLDAAGIPDPTSVSFGWEVSMWILGRILDKAERELGKLVNVRVLYMELPEAFQLAPWTCVFLDGPRAGTDTWDAVELRGGYKDALKYRWFAAAGAITQWAAHFTVRPSLFVGADVHFSCPPSELVLSPSRILVQLVRDQENWERLDRYLVENYLGKLNAPMFIVWVDPTINYELLDQEVLRWAGVETQGEGPSLTRRQFWRSGSICSGADTFIGRNRARVDFDARHPDAVHLAATVLPVEITFERAKMPVGGFMLQKGDLRVQLSEPLLPSGTVGEHYCVNWYESKWWYLTLADKQAQAEQRRRQMQEVLDDTADYYRFNWGLRVADWEAQVEHVTQLRRSQSAQWKRMSDDAERAWLTALGDGFRIRNGELTLAADSRLSTTVHTSSLGWRFVPKWSGLQIAEPIRWEQLVIDQPAAAAPDLDACEPELRVEGNRVVLTYKSPRTGKTMTAIFKTPPAVAVPGPQVPGRRGG